MKKTNQERILDSLLEFSKTTVELISELGYVKPDEPPGYNVISRDLGILKKMGLLKIRR